MLHSQLQLGVEALDLCLAHCKIPNTVVKGTVSRNFLPSFFLLRERNLFEPLIHMLNYFGMYRIRKYFHQVCWVPNKFVALSLLPRWAYSSPGKNRLLDFSTESRFLKFLSRIKYSPMTAPAGEELCNSTQVFSPMNCSKISRLRVLVQLRRYSQSFSKLRVLPKTEAILEFFKVWFVDRAFRSKKG